MKVKFPPSFTPSLPHSLTHSLTPSVDDEDEPECQSPPLTLKDDSFDEIYKPFELTDFDGLLAKNLGRPVEYDTHAVPYYLCSSVRL